MNDEHYVDINRSGSRIHWAPQRAAVLPTMEQRRQNVPNFMIWAGIAKGWRTELLILPKGVRMNSEDYISKVLTPKLMRAIKTHKGILMQDGASCHSSRQTLAHLSKCKVEVLDAWPSHSPDLNPVEQIWSWLDRDIRRRCPTNEEELIRETQAAWREMPQDVVDKFATSFKAKCQRVLEVEDGRENGYEGPRGRGRPKGSQNKPNSKRPGPKPKKKRQAR